MKKMGRPTKYEERFVQEAEKYLANCKDEEYDWTKSVGKVGTSWEHRIKVKLPTLEGFSLVLNVNMETLSEWGNKYPDFSVALKNITKEQQKRLLNKGLSGDYNPTIAKLILSANHGMREKSDITTDGKEIPTPMYGGQSK